MIRVRRDIRYVAGALLTLVCVGACVAVLAGCTTTDYGRTDIANYVRETYGLTRFSVSKEAEKVEGTDGYTDYRWTVTVRDEPAVEFYVLDDYHWGMETLANHLEDDYEAMAVAVLLEGFGSASFDPELTTDDTGLRSMTLTGSFTSRAGLERLLSDTYNFLKYARENCGADSLSVTVDFACPDAYLKSVGDDFIRALPTDVNATFQTNEDINTQVSAAEDSYLLACVDYQLGERLSEFTTAEVEKAVGASEHQLQVRRTDGTAGVYADLLGGDMWNVSLGTLYEVLRREGFSPVGTGEHFTFVGTDGCTYEFSSEFQGAQTGVTTRRNYNWGLLDAERDVDRGYFLRNGEVYPLLNTCSRVDYRTVKCATGLELFDEWSLGTKYTWDISDYEL